MAILDRNVQSLVEDQVLRWRLGQRSDAERAARPGAAPLVIAVARDYGALGTAVATRVAERLGFQLWDQELVHRIATETGASEELLRSLDEHARGALEDMLDGILLGVEYTESEYLRALMRVVHAIAAHGRAVFVGRGVSFILTPAQVLAVRVIAPRDLRVRRVMDDRHLTESAARRELERVERERARFLEHQYLERGDDPTRYDLLVNTGRLTVEVAAEAIVGAYRAKLTQAGRVASGASATPVGPSGIGT